jgi:hypothetical protein
MTIQAGAQWISNSMSDGLDIMQTHPKVLIIGAGAVGQAYGFHLMRGGARISYFVREKYREELARGLVVRCLNGRARGRYEYSDFELLTNLEDVAEGHWDQVWFCVSSPALRGDWLPDLATCIGDATVVMLQPGTDDYAWVTTHIPAKRVVHGMITLASYHAPLPGDDGETAMHWWFPPFSPAPFCGEASRVDEIVGHLKDGGMAAKRARDITVPLRIGSGILMPLIAAMEMGGWRLQALKKPGLLALASRAARQATQISLPSKRRLMVYVATTPIVLKLILFIAPRVTPFNLEVMLQIHFTKVGEQTREMLRRYIEMGREQNQPHDAVRELLKGISNQALIPSETG